MSYESFWQRFYSYTLLHSTICSILFNIQDEDLQIRQHWPL